MCGGGKDSDSVEDEGKKYGEPVHYDPDFSGPIKNRSCTDIICLLIFIVFLLGWIILAGLAFKFGNPEMLVYPTDSAGNVCGQGKLDGKPFLYFFDLSACANPSVLIKGCPTPQVCVERCPNETFIAHVQVPPIINIKYRDLQSDVKKKLICKYKVNENKTVDDLINREDCARITLQSDALMGRCIPLLSAFKDADDDLQKNVTLGAKAAERFIELKSVGEKIFADFKKIWPLLVLALILAMSLSLFWIIIMRWIAWVMVWLSILLVIALLSVGSWYCFHRYNYLKNNHNITKDNFEFVDGLANTEALKSNKNTWLTVGIIAVVILVLLLLIILFLRNRIRLAIGLIQESSKAVGSIMSSLFFPLIPFIFQLGLISLWFAIAVHLASAQFPTSVVTKIPDKCNEVCSGYKLGGSCTTEKFERECKIPCHDKYPDVKPPDCYFLAYDKSDAVTAGQLFNLFGLFWGVFFVAGLGEMVLAGAFATWYWTYEKKNIPVFVISNSFGRTLRYHLGSLAFGSLLIAIVRMIRVILEYIDRKLKEYTDNPAVKALMCCLKCCFWCLERFIKFINRNAYIMIAVYGKNFCTSARNAFSLLMRNIVRVVVLDKVTDFLLFLAKLIIVAGIGVLSFSFLNGEIPIEFLKQHKPALNYNAIPVAVIIIGTYLVATCFFNVYSMAVDTVFLCFLQDCEMNDGSQEKPYHMSKKLMKILGKKNKFSDPSEAKTP